MLHRPQSLSFTKLASSQLWQSMRGILSPETVAELLFALRYSHKFRRLYVLELYWILNDRSRSLLLSFGMIICAFLPDMEN